MVVGLVLLTAGCGYTLPPAEQLQQGCHVWYRHKGSARGVSARVDRDGAAQIQGGSATQARMVDGSIELDGTAIGKLDGRRVLVGEGNPFEAELYVDLATDARQLPVRFIKGDVTAFSIERSAGCSVQQTALGAAPVVVVTREAIPEHKGIPDGVR
jgi:hypothetical protein